VEFPSDLIEDDPGNTDAAGIGQFFQPRGDVDPITKYVVRLDDDVAQIDADAKDDRAAIRHFCIALGDTPLDADHGLDRIDSTREPNPGASTHDLHDPAAKLGDDRLYQRRPELIEFPQCSPFIGFHQAAVSDTVPCHDGRKPPLDTLFRH